MNNQQSDRLDMFRAVITFADQSAAIHASRPAFADGINLLRNIVVSIDAAIATQSSEVAGLFTDKNTLQENLCQALLVVMGGTKAYAASIGNNSLKEQMDYPISELRRISDESIVPFADNILALVTPIGAPLIPFGVDVLEITNLTNAKTTYSAFESQPRLAVTARATQTENIINLITEGMRLLRDMIDGIAITIKAANPDWYSQYNQVRKIVNTGGNITTLQGVVKDSVTNLPLYNVEVVIGDLGINTFTDVEGKYKFQPISPATYSNVKFGAADYNVLYLPPFEIPIGQTIVKDVLLVHV